MSSSLELLAVVGLCAMLMFQLYTMSRVGDIDRRLTRIEIVMVMQKIMPGELIIEAKD